MACAPTLPSTWEGDVHRQIARTQAAGPLPPASLAAAGEDRLQHHRIGAPGERIGATVAIERPDGESGGIQHHRRSQSCDRLLDQRGARRILEAWQIKGGSVEPHSGQSLQQRIHRRQIAALHQRPVENQERHWTPDLAVDATVDPGPRQRHRLSPTDVAPQQRGGVAQTLAGVVEAAFGQITPQGAL